MSDARRIHWKWIVIAAFVAEATVLALFFLLLFAATAAGVPEIARPMTPLYYVDAVVMSFLSMLVVTLWVGKRIDSGFVLHGVLIATVAILLFAALWSTTGTLMQPFWYVVAHGFKILGGITGGLLAERRRRRAPA